MYMCTIILNHTIKYLYKNLTIFNMQVEVDPVVFPGSVFFLCACLLCDYRLLMQKLSNNLAAIADIIRHLKKISYIRPSIYMYNIYSLYSLCRILAVIFGIFKLYMLVIDCQISFECPIVNSQIHKINSSNNKKYTNQSNHLRFLDKSRTCIS